MLAILLTTYNGEKYIREQLDSIICQSCSNWNLFIRDDGSKDNTVAICKEYSEKDSRIVIIDDNQKHRGPGEGFMWLLQNVEADYYMFCDQDDYWLNEKVQLTFNRMLDEENNNKGKPIIVYSDAKIVDSHLQEISPSWYEYSGMKSLKCNQEFFLVLNMALGCTIMINSIAKKIMYPYEQYSIMHDYWLALKVYAHHGVMAFIDKPLMKYRQHANNTLGAAQTVGLLKRIKHLPFYYKRFKECWIMSHKITGVSFIRFMFLKIRSKIL